MSQFTATKNPPWARPQSVASDMIPASVATPLSVSNTLAQQQVASNMMAPGIGSQTVYSIGSSTPNLQPPQYTTQQQPPQFTTQPPQYAAQQISIGLQQQAAMQQQVPPTIIPQPGIAIPTTLATSQQVTPVSYPNPRVLQQQNTSPKQRVFTGTVTKLHDNFGFVDEDVFFQTSCVKGNIPKVGERVLVEATYNPNMPFKWNATRIQLLPNQNSNMSGGKPNIMGQSMPPSLMGDNPVIGSRPFTSRKGERFRDRERKGFNDIKREPRERMERPMPPPKKRSRSRSPSKRPEGGRSPSRRRMRVVPRYVVQIPKLSFNLKNANVITLKSRYNSMYIPSDFFKANFCWMDAFPLTRPFQLGHHCEFHVLHKDVEPLNTSDALLDPPDADHSYNAKVMLLACPELDDLYHKSCSLSEDPADIQENFVHPTRLINFLVGIKGKNETMAIGGPWSPSQDGLNPEDDPKVLIKTAIRTSKALTGIDLSSCTQWYRFAEVRYLRPEETHKGKHLMTRVETTVIFFPDVWSCNPSRLEWASLQTAYKKQLQKKIATISDGGKESTSQEDDEDSENIEVQDPTHFSQLDPKAMKIIDLRKELEARTLSSKGLKSQLIARLTKSLKMEQEKEESEEQVKEDVPSPMEEEVQKNLEEEKSEEKKKEEEEKKRKEEKEKASLERKYALPENPAILVHPNPAAKSGKFDCSVMSLSVLLDYRPEDNKEHSFEVSLFAELFNEMLMRDFSFEIYKSLVKAPEKKEEEKKEKDKDKEKEKDSKDKEKEKDKDKEKEKKTDEKTNKEPTPKKRKTDEKETKKDSEKNDRRAYVVKKEDDKNDDKKDEEDDESEDKKKKKDKKKFFTRFPSLLLSFTYFDQNHTGYLLDKDIEEIIHTIGLQLSRAQVKKLVLKCISRDSMHYRKITDKPLPGQGGEKEKEAKEVQVIDTEKLAVGNAEYDPDAKAVKASPNRTSKKGEGEVLTGMVNYKGSVLDIESLLDRLEKSEKTRLDMEKEMQKLSKEKDAIKASLDSKEESTVKLKDEVKQTKQKLSNQEKLTNFSESASRKYISALMLSKDHLTTMLDTVTAALDEKDMKKEDIIKKETEREVTVKKENGDS